jgi:hypothetical protein
VQTVVKPEIRRTFIPYRSIDYIYIINLALQKVLEARAEVRDAITFERYLRAVEALYAILIPKLKNPKIKELLKEARKHSEGGLITEENLESVDRAVELILEALDKNYMLMKGEVHEEEIL